MEIMCGKDQYMTHEIEAKARRLLLAQLAVSERWQKKMFKKMEMQAFDKSGNRI